MSHMDLNYSYALISFLVGILSGFQTIAERYKRSRLRAVLTRGGLLYLGLRGLISAAVFSALYLSSFYWSSVVHNRPLLWAFVCGTGAEVILRSKIFVREKETSAGGVEEVMRGPLNLLISFQNLFLDLIEEELTPLELKSKIARADKRIEALRLELPKDKFEDVCERIEMNLDAFDDQTIVQNVTEAIQQMRAEYEAGTLSNLTSGVYEDKFKYKLAYKLLKLVGEDGFRTLVSEVVRYTIVSRPGGEKDLDRA